MINYLNDSKKTQLEAHGNVVEITSDVATLIALVYHRLGKPIIQEAFRKAMKGLVEDDSLVWSTIDNPAFAPGTVAVTACVDTRKIKNKNQND